MPAIPKRLLDEYYLQNREVFPEWEKYVKAVIENPDRDLVEKMATELYNLSDSGDRDTFDQEYGLQEWRQGAAVQEEEEPSLATATLRKAVQSTKGAVGGLAGATAGALDYAQQKISDGGAPTAGPTGLVSGSVTEQATGEEQAEDESDPDTAITKALYGIAESIEIDNQDAPRELHSWKDFKAATPEQKLKMFAPMIVEHGVGSLPYMLIAIANLPAAMATMAGQALNERTNFGERQPTGKRLGDCIYRRCCYRSRGEGPVPGLSLARRFGGRLPD